MFVSFCRCVVPECCVCHASLDVVCDVSEYGMFVCVGLSVNVYMFHHHRFIVPFPIGLDFPLITLPFQGC